MRSVHVRAIARIAVVAIAMVMVTGCTKGDRDLRQWVAQQKAKKGAPLPPLPVLKTFETFVYKDQDKRDPFGPSLEEQQRAQGPRPDNHPKEPLESYPLDSLKMVGTIGTGKKIQGLIKDPDGVIHLVHVDNYLGQNYGKIDSISESEIDLVELIPNGSGGWMKRQAKIALGEK